MTILRCAHGSGPQTGAPEFGHVIHDHEVGVEVDDSPDAGFKHVGEVVSSIVEGLFQCLSDRRGDELPDTVGVEVVDFGLEMRES